ncbi:hypothetical protein TELCIR_04730 [Teladorsagia circumcincta]|uniref:Uncharacterized protein n=1 Tax=Teladorsagia circumcincta TaxID=45464 RepID=A0A2G9USQ7_TELCI|nr:hypothetical protein TELCIR_04730 [Teladorsagia circumcincta]
MGDENPLIQSTTSTSPSTIIRRYENGVLTSLATVIVCFRSLYGAVAVNHANSPYSTLIIGDYSILRRPARIFCPRFHNRPQKTTNLPASDLKY